MGKNKNTIFAFFSNSIFILQKIKIALSFKIYIKYKEVFYKMIEFDPGSE